MNSSNFKVKSNTNILFDSMIEVIEVMDSNNIISFLNYGALLGYVRENRLLPWNNDVEICAYLTDEFKNNISTAMSILENKGYSVLYHEYAGTLSVKKKEVDINVNIIWKKNKYYIRPHHTGSKRSHSSSIAFVLYWLASYIFAYEVKKNKRNSNSMKSFLLSIYMNFFQSLSFSIRLKIFNILIKLSRIFKAKYLSTAVPCQFYDELKIVKFNGFKVRIPSKNEELLTYIYGSNWRTPKDSWSFYDKKNKNETNIKFINEQITVSDWRILK